MSTKMAQPVIMWPHKAAEILGQEGAQEVVDLINHAMASVSATKVDKNDYDAHVQAIKAQFDSMRADMKAQIRGALLTGLAWVTVLVFGQFIALYTALK